MNDANSLPNVAIIGRPNVGKSALFNRLIGRKISIVHGQPGITRDRLSAICTRCERPFMLWDTGGIFVPQSRDELTQQVRRAADEALGQSDLLLFVVDAKRGVLPVDKELARMLRKSRKPVVLVVNKIDNEKHEHLVADFDSLGFDNVISVSAEHGRGTSQLLEIIEQYLPSAADSETQPSATGRSVAIAIVGRPNVGKSSLINSIVQSERAIVSELPGTTRDAIDVLYERDGSRCIFIDTAGIRRRGRHSSSAEVFSVMRAERSIRRADVCVLVIDLTAGVTAQDKRIAGLIQQARKPAIVVLNKWDLIKPARMEKRVTKRVIDEAYAKIFFLQYAPLLITSAATGQDVHRLFGLVEKIQNAARKRIGTGVLNRLLRNAFETNPPPLVKGKRLKLFYAAQTTGDTNASHADGGAPGTPELAPANSPLRIPEFVLFVNDPQLMTQAFHRYIEARIRNEEPYPGLPIILTLRRRTEGKRDRPASPKRIRRSN